MRIAKVFKSGNSQAVRLPKEFQFACEEVEIFREGSNLVIRERTKNLGKALKLLTQMSDDFFSEGRKDIPPQDREFFK
jgi:antitoxin VapB